MNKLQICVSVYKKSLEDLTRLIKTIPNKIDIRLDFDGGWEIPYDPAKIEELQLHNTQIILHENNLGLANIRNYQLSECTHEYIQWVDADDYLTPSALKRMRFDTDLIVTPVTLINQKGRFVEYRNCKVATNKQQTYFIIPSIIFRKQFLIDNELYFDNSGHIFEDIMFSTLLTFTKHTVQVVSDYPYYNYINEIEGSLSHPDKLDKIIESTFYFINQLKSLPWKSEYKSVVYTRIVEEGLRLLSINDLSNELRLKVIDLLKPYKFF